MKPKRLDRSTILTERQTFETTEDMNRKIWEKADSMSITKSALCRIALAEYLEDNPMTEKEKIIALVEELKLPVEYTATGITVPKRNGEKLEINFDNHGNRVRT